VGVRDLDVKLTEIDRSTKSVWFLAGQLSDAEPVRLVPINSTPFHVGRRPGLALSIPRRTVSGLHAEIVVDGESLLLRDLESTNGTFVNGHPIIETLLEEEDLIQFADVPFRVRRQSTTGALQTVQEEVHDQAFALMQMDRIISERAVVPFYQPIVDLANEDTIGYEVLARSNVVGMHGAMDMFRAAQCLGVEVELSRICRWEGIRATASLASPPHLFVNTHPKELTEPGLTQSIRAVREISPAQPITLEIHEGGITDPSSLKDLRSVLRDLDIRLAFDDFGAGQARLVELTEVRPDYLKFDMSLIRDIHLAPPERQDMLATLVRMVNNLGIVSLAEGVECADEHATCLQLGFQLGQGFHYGRPAPVFSCD
jgi:EAL domain-containing protein (putative c-di-GMP-specific phosphodiesterase class I)